MSAGDFLYTRFRSYTGTRLTLKGSVEDTKNAVQMLSDTYDEKLNKVKQQDGGIKKSLKARELER